MGTNKALLRFPNGETVIERIVRRVAPFASEVLVATNTQRPYAFLHLPMFEDDYPGAASLGGLYTGLRHAQDDRALVLSCDLPLVNPDLLRFLLALDGDHDLVVPLIEDRFQPLHAVYRKSALDVIRAQIETGDLRVTRLASVLNSRIVTASELRPEWLTSFRNMNTPEDWAEVQRLASADG